MNALEKRIREELADAIQLTLAGNAADYAAYASCIARYRVLKQLVDFIDERHRAVEAGDTKDDE